LNDNINSLLEVFCFKQAVLLKALKMLKKHSFSAVGHHGN